MCPREVTQTLDDGDFVVTFFANFLLDIKKLYMCFFSIKLVLRTQDLLLPPLAYTLS